jgi:1-deoxy-D-xylulose 5-phosphate reductoisomerase
MSILEGPPNNALQLTSGGPMRASRASLMRRLQLNAVLCRPSWALEAIPAE